jgi:hypothetical protein
MGNVETIKPEDKFVNVDGLKLRYIEDGSGHRCCFCTARRSAARRTCFGVISALLPRLDFAR